MKKQVKNQIFKSVLLLLSVALLVIGSAVGVLANSTLEKDLTITFDADVEECLIYVKNTADADWEFYQRVEQSGTVVSVPYNKSVKLTVVPSIGKWPLIIVEGETVSVQQGSSVSWTPFKEPASVSITCTDRTYVIHALDFDQTADLSYSPVSGSIYTNDELTNGSVTYQYGNLTELPVVEKEDYDFYGWNIKMGEGPNDFLTVKADEDGKYYIPQDLTRTKYFDTSDGTIFVYPDMRPKEYPVYREDRIFDSDSSGNLGDKLFGAIEQNAPVTHKLSAIAEGFWNDDIALGGYKQYTGYLLMDATEYDYGEGWEIGEPPADDPHYNTVYRFYKPIQYELVYDLNNNGDVIFSKIDTYTYANPTAIANPSSRGYTFLGWQVEIYNAAEDKWVNPLGAGVLAGTDFVLGNGNATYDKDGRYDPNAIYASDAQADGKYQIRLTAQWSANTYTITYKWGEGVSEDLIQNKLDLPTSFVFATDCSILNPVRAGYTFEGWTLSYTDNDSPADPSGLVAEDGKYALNGSTYAANVTLTAKWTVESYKAEFEVDGEVFGNGFDVTYDQELPINAVEVPVKYGYNFMGFFSAPNGEGENYFDAAGNCAVEKWGLDGENEGTITLYAHWERKPVSITVSPIEKVPEGVIITIFEADTNVSHPCTPGTPVELLFGTKFYVKIEMPDGFQIVEWNGALVESYSGTVYRSDIQTIETEDAIVLVAKARPEAPEVGVGEDIESVIVESDTSVKVNFADGTVSGYYEVAISPDKNDTNLNWNQVPNGDTHYIFTGLNPGTTYYIFIRLKETDDTHSGIPAVKQELTRYDAYVNETIEKLNGMFQEGDGKVTQALIQVIVNKIEELKNSETLPTDFYEQIENLIKQAEENIAFTRFKDTKIAILESFLLDCFNKGSFNEANTILLGALCDAAVADISAADTEDAVTAIFNTAKAEMEAVPVTYLRIDGTMTLTSLAGLKQGGGIVLNSVEDIKALRRAVADAIAQGKITAYSSITLEEATELLRALDTVAAYHFYLINVQPAEGDGFIFTMTIPQNLAGRTGLQAAYYNAATGKVELLKTTQEGDKLIFHADRVADFIILADPVIELTNVIVALGFIVLCLLIAVVFVLAARSKAKNAVQHASVALPMFLAIHFLPVNAELIALGLIAAALILIVVLMWLLLSSNMIRIFKVKKAKPVAAEASVAARAEDLQADPGSVFDEEAPIGEEQIDNEQADGEFIEDAQEEVAQEAYAEETGEVYDEEVEEVYDDEEFVEGNPDSYYSPDDEENVYEYNQEETERVSDVDTADQETEETPYGEGTSDGSVGEAYVRDSYAGDEAGSPRYEDEYGESYEYGDEEDAPYAEAEEIGGEETGSEGSVDPKAYLVNEEEELSNDEEMYRYDE